MNPRTPKNSVLQTLRSGRLFLLSVPAFLWLSAALLFTCVPGFAQTGSPPVVRSAAEDQDYTFAFGLYTDKLYQLAAEQFDSYLSKYPSSARRQDATFLRAECAFHLADYAGAVAGFRTLVREYPDGSLWDDASLRIGQSLLSLDRPAEAVAPLKSVVDLVPESPLAGEASYWLGEAYEKQNDPANAVKYYTLSYEHFPTNPYRDYALYAVAWMDQSKGRYAEALTTYRMLVDSIPASGLAQTARVRIGECRFGMTDYKGAAGDMTASLPSITSDKERGQAYFLIAESHDRLGNAALARTYYRRLTDELPAHPLVPNAVYGMGWTYLQQASYDSAAAWFGRLTDGDGPLAHAARYRRATAVRLSGKQDSALALLGEVVRRDPAGEFADNALTDRADVLLAAGDVAAAKQAADRVVREFPSSDVRADALRIAGECRLREGDAAGARGYLTAAADIPNARYDVVVAAEFQGAWAAFKSGAYDTASAAFGSFVQRYGQHPKAYEARYWQAEAEYRRGNFERSSTLYAAVASVEGGSKRDDALYGVGWSYYKLGRYADAAAAFDRLTKVSPRSPFLYDARLRQADAYFAQKDYPRAGATYRAAVRAFPDSAANDYAWYQAAQSSYRASDFAEAYRQFAELVQMLPGSPLADDAQYAMGWVNFQRKDYTEAIKEFQKVLRQFPTGDAAPRAYYSLGDCYYNLGQYAAAERSYREVLRLYADSKYVADAAAGLQYALVAQGKDKEAATAIDAFIADHPGTRAAQELQLKKGELAFGQQNYEGAAAAYRQFLDTYRDAPGRGQASFWLGRSLQRLGRTDPAAVAFQSAARLPGTFRGPATLEAVDLWLGSGKFDKAFETVTEAERTFAGDGDVLPELLYRKGRIYAENGNAAAARRQFEQVSQQYPSHVAADRSRLGLARLSMNEGNAMTARSIAERIASARTDDVGAEAQCLVGDAYASSGQWKPAITAYLRVRYVFASYESWIQRSMLGLSQAYARSGETAKAASVCRDLLSRKPPEEIRVEAERRLKDLERR